MHAYVFGSIVLHPGMTFFANRVCPTLRGGFVETYSKFKEDWNLEAPNYEQLFDGLLRGR